MDVPTDQLGVQPEEGGRLTAFPGGFVMPEPQWPLQNVSRNLLWRIRQLFLSQTSSGQQSFSSDEFRILLSAMKGHGYQWLNYGSEGEVDFPGHEILYRRYLRSLVLGSYSLERTNRLNCLRINSDQRIEGGKRTFIVTAEVLQRGIIDRKWNLPRRLSSSNPWIAVYKP